MSKTNIEWTDATWNPTRGCSLVSPGCTNCYAMKFAHRFSGEGGRYQGLTRNREHGGPVWTGKVETVAHMLDAPLHWEKPQRVFVNSMSDLFHDDVPDDFIALVFGIMALCPRHTFQVLTKRAERMALWLGGGADKRVKLALEALAYTGKLGERWKRGPLPQLSAWPLPNVWLGVSVEDQQRADERIPHLLRTPAAVRFLSCEPLLEAVDLHAARYAHPDGSTIGAVTSWDGGVDWVIVGGESGPGARPFDLAWARALVVQCKAAGVPCFVKQLGADPRDPTMGGSGRYLCTDPKGGDMAEWPEDLRVREMPEARR